jgi:hypothetical protein
MMGYLRARLVTRRIRANLALFILGDIPCIANARLDGQQIVLWGDGALISGVTIQNAPGTAIMVKGNPLQARALPENLSGFGHFGGQK